MKNIVFRTIAVSLLIITSCNDRNQKQTFKKFDPVKILDGGKKVSISFDNEDYYISTDSLIVFPELKISKVPLFLINSNDTVIDINILRDESRMLGYAQNCGKIDRFYFKDTVFNSSSLKVVCPDYSNVPSEKIDFDNIAFHRTKTNEYQETRFSISSPNFENYIDFYLNDFDELIGFGGGSGSKLLMENE